MNNLFKENICNNKFQLGLWSSLCSETSADVIGGAGFDWILLDMEHSANDVKSVMSQARGQWFNPTSRYHIIKILCLSLNY